MQIFDEWSLLSPVTRAGGDFNGNLIVFTDTPLSSPGETSQSQKKLPRE